MFRHLANIFSAFGKKKSGSRSAVASRRPKAPRPSLEELESRLVPSSAPLHAAGNQLQDSAGHVVVLRGVNVVGLESYPTGLTGDANQVLRSADVALSDWHANLLRLTVYPDFWFGHDQGVGLGEAADGGAAYRNLVNQIIGKAKASNAYVMLAVWGSDMGNPGAAPALHDMPDGGTTQFWNDATVGAARLYANDPAVLFDPFNEPHNVSWDQWRNGSTNGRPQINDNGTTYDSPGMQGLLDAIRNTGANNIVAPEGLGWGSDLSGVAQGFGLSDRAGNLMYQFHFYPAHWQTPADGDARMQAVSQYPIYLGEFGTPADANGAGADVNGVPQPDAPTWTRNIISWLNQHQYSWTAWSLAPNTPPSLISDWNYTPTNYFGAIVKDALTTAQPNNPVNDTFASRIVVSGLSATVTGSNVNATREAGEPTIVGNAGGKSVWWTWTASASGSVTINTAGSNFDTLLGVYTGSSVSGLTLVAGNDDAAGVQSSLVTFNAVAGVTYQIAVDGYNAASGSITLNVTLTPAGPANNNFASRIVIGGSSATVTGTNVNATKQAGEPNIVGNAGGKSVWWTWTAPASGSVTLSTAGSNFDTLLGVYTGSSVSGLTLVAGNDDAAGVQSSLVTFNAVAGVTYQIAVDGYNAASGNITLNVTLTPAGPANNFASRTVISGSSVTATGSNVNATRETGEPTIVGNPGGHSVWWSWTAPTSGSVTISTAGSNFDTLLGVYTGTSVSSLTLVAGNDDASGVQTSLVTFNAVAGTTYQIAVDGYNGASGNITLSLRYV